MDLHLKFKDETEANSVLFDEHSVVLDSELGTTETYKAYKFQNTDVIGYQYKEVLDGDGNPITVPDCYLVNVRVIDEDSSTIEPYSIQVLSPMRVWA